MELIVISILAATSVFLLVMGIFNKPKGVDLHDEYKEVKTSTRKEDKTKTLALGCAISMLIAYVITGKLLFVLISIPGGLVVAQWINNRKEKKRKEILNAQYIQILNGLLTALQSKSSPYQALEEIVTGLPSPAYEIWVKVLTKARTSTSHKERYVEAIKSVANEEGWEELHYIEMAYSVYGRVGGNLVEVFQHLLESAYEDNADRKDVIATTSMGRSSALIISFFPFVLVGILRFTAPEYASPLFDTVGGNIVLLFTLISVVIGNKIIGKMMDKVIQESL